MNTASNALQLVQRVLSDKSFDSWKATRGALGTMDDALFKEATVQQLVPALIEQLGNKIWYVAVSAAAVLAKIGDVRAVEPLLENALETTSAGPARMYLDALALLDSSAITSAQAIGKVEELIDTLKKRSTDILRQSIGEADITDGHIEAIATVLGEIRDDRAVVPLLELITSQPLDWPRDAPMQVGIGARLAAATALGRIGDPRAVGVLAKAAEQGFPSLREASKAALDAIKSRRESEGP